MLKKTYHISGMHCRSCEVLIEDRVKKISGVAKVRANSKKGKLDVFWRKKPKDSIINKAVSGAGYKLEGQDIPAVPKKSETYFDLLVAAFFVAVLYLIFRNFDISRFINLGAYKESSLLFVLILGITAGFSTCMALVGGLVLGISARHAKKHQKETVLQKFRPHLFFNLGRVVSFFILGGLIGQLGSMLQFSGKALGLMVILAGLVMLILGIKIVGIFPKFSAVFTLPKAVVNFFGMDNFKEKEYSHLNSSLLGALTFFLPCGFTQATQVYAVSTGSFIRGGMIMGVFALGTTPGLLGIGGLTSVIKGNRGSKIIFKFIGLLVILLSIVNILNGLNLSGIRSVLPQGDKIPTSSDNEIGESLQEAYLEDGKQIIKGIYTEGDVLQPKYYSVKAKKPVRFEILAKDDGVGCMGSVMISGLIDDYRFFEKGKTIVFEFIPEKTGKYYITCAMGIPAGALIVE